MNDQRTILVTGGGGFIGCNFVKMLLAEEPELRVVNFDALTYAGNLENLADIEGEANYEFVKGDIRDRAALEAACREFAVEGIVNFAAESHVDRSIAEPNVFVETNIGGTLNLLQLAQELGMRRFLQVSTDEVYGSLGPEGLFTEKTPVQPNSPYSASKAAADHLVRAFHHTHGLDTVTTRCSNNYGPYQFPEKMLPLMFNNARRDQPLPVYGDGLQVRDWLYVYDHCTAVWRAYEDGAAGEVYNIGGGNEKANLEVVRAILDFLGKPDSLISFVADRPGHDRRYAIDASKIERELGWRPSVAFEAGLERTLTWYQDNLDWVERVTSGAYRDYYERMYQGR